MNQYWTQLLERISPITHICFGVGLALHKPAYTVEKFEIFENISEDAIMQISKGDSTC